MTKISSTGSNFDIWNLLDQPTVNNGEKSKQMQDAVPELKGQKIRTDSLELSKEGMTALREKVQSMPGRIDMEEMMQMREILPKLKLNPEDDFYWALKYLNQDAKFSNAMHQLFFNITPMTSR